MMSQLPEIGRYQLLKRLATGGMGEVYLARQRSSVEGFVRLFAIKVLLESYSKNQSFVNMFLEEARVAAKLNHRNIVQVVDIDRHQDQFYMVMEYIPGQNLRELLGDASIPGRSLFEPRLGAELFSELSSALGIVHASGLIHRDVSPNNIMIGDSGVPKLIDFGVARATSNASLTTPGTLKGKFGYMAPEYVRGHGYDHRADVFSLGVVMWETFCRKRLFRGGSAAEQLHHLLDAEIPPIHQLVPDFPPLLSDVVAVALQRDPEQRFPTAAALTSALTQVAINLQPAKDSSLSSWLDRHVATRMAERKRVDEVFLAMSSGTEIPAFDEPTMSPGMSAGSIPGTYGVYEVGGSPPKPAVRPSGQISNEFASTKSGSAGTSIRQGAGEMQMMPMAPSSGSRHRYFIGGLAVLAVLAALVIWIQIRTSPPTAVDPAPVAATTTTPSRDLDLAEAHRRIGLKALAEKDFGRARREFTEALSYGDAGGDLGDLVKLAAELEAAAATNVAVAAPPPTPAPDSSEIAGVTSAAAPLPVDAGAPPPKATVAPKKTEVARNRRPEPRPEPRASKIEVSRPRTDLEPKPSGPPMEQSNPAPAVSAEVTGLGDLTITSTPLKLLVRVDGKVVGQTTLMRIPLSVGPHQVAIVQGDRIVHTETVTIREKDHAFVNFEAPPAPPVIAPAPPPAAPKPPPPVAAARPAITEVGEVEVSSPNVVGELFVNGVARGWAPMVVKGVPVGRTLIEIRVDGEVRRKKTITVRASQRALVRFQ